MLGALYWEDVSELSIFKCKLCTTRLQHPIMQVDAFGSICGSCCERSVFTNVSENTDIEKILSKLYMPCKYQERGCSFEDMFLFTCQHERQCKFKGIKCPFAFADDCEGEALMDVADHFQTNHKDNILMPESESVLIQNPIELKCDIFYLINIKQRHLILRCKSDEAFDEYFYSLYYFDDDNNDLDEVLFSFVTQYGKLKLRSEEIKAVNYSQITTRCNSDGLTLSSELLTNLKCQKEICVDFTFKKKEENKEFNNNIDFYKCHICGKCCVNVVFVCNIFNHALCKRCNNKMSASNPCSCGATGARLSKDIFMLDENFKFKCDCNELFSRYEYEMHQEICFNNCPFEKVANCKWKGIYTKMMAHIKEIHPPLTGNVKILTGVPTTDVISILKYDKIFICEYSLTLDILRLRVGVIGPFPLDNLYVWELVLRKKDSFKSITMSDSCDNIYQSRSISCNVKKYIAHGHLEFVIFIRNRYRSSNEVRLMLTNKRDSFEYPEDNCEHSNILDIPHSGSL